MKSSHCLLLVLLLAAWRPCLAEDAPPADPILRIEAGMHTAMITRISADRAGKLILTCSNDKTARLWSAEVASGTAGSTSVKPLKILRPPAGNGHEGKLYACALSPDGKLAAVAGYTGYEWDQTNSIYIFDTATGNLIRRFAGLANGMNDLAFSGSGRWLAAALLGSNGVSVWDTATGKEVYSDTEYTSDVYGVDWYRDERLVTSCYDGLLRLYEAQAGSIKPLKLVAKTQPRGGKYPHMARFSPDGNQLALGFADSCAVSVLDARDLSFLLSPTPPDDPEGGSLESVTWVQTATGDMTLVAAGRYQANSLFQARLWSRGGKGPGREIPLSAQTIRDIRGLPGGRLLFGAADPAWGFLTLDGKSAPVTLGQAPVADFRNFREGFLVSADASVVTFAFEVFGESPASFSLGDRSLRMAPPPAPKGMLHPPREDGLPVTDWVDSLTPKLRGQPLKMDSFENSRCLSIAPDKSFLVMGGDWTLRCFETDGSERWNVSAPGVAWAVNLSKDGKLVVTAYSDGTIRWYRSDTGRELLAFYPHTDRQRWVLWTPQGYYDCSPDGESLIGWHVNRSKVQASDFFPASQFRDRFYRPDVIARVLDSRDVAAALQTANTESGRRPQAMASADDVIRQMQPPVVELAVGGSLGEVEVTGDSFTLRYRVRRTGTEEITRVRVLVDGRPLDLALPIPADGAVAEVTVPVPDRDCVLTILAEHRFAISQPATVRLRRAGGPPPPDPSARFVSTTPAALKPKLYILAAGVADYQHNERLGDLQYPAKDAKDFVAAFERQNGGLYQKVEARVLTDAQATAGDILDGLDWIKKQTTAKDVAIIFLSGHGENDEELRYYFCPHDYDHARRLRTGVAMEDIQRTLAAVAGKVLFFIDSCHAGNALGKMFAAKGSGDQVDLTRLVNELSSAENGAVVFASSTGRQVSVESDEWQNGAFTKAIVEGLDGKADLMRNGKITIAGLETYIAERVKELSEGTQTPTVAKPQTVPDFPIAVGK